MGPSFFVLLYLSMKDLRKKQGQAETKLDEILHVLAEIKNEIKDLRRSQNAAELNVRAIQQAYHQTQSQVAAIECRCTQRGDLIRAFLEQLECAGPPQRQASSDNLPAFNPPSNHEPACGGERPGSPPQPMHRPR